MTNSISTADNRSRSRGVIRCDNAGELLKSSEKRLLPRFVLTGAGGTASNSLVDLLDWDRLIWNLVGGVIQRIRTTDTASPCGFGGASGESSETKCEINTPDCE